MGNTGAQEKIIQNTKAKVLTNFQETPLATFSILSTALLTSKLFPTFVLTNLNQNNESPKIIISNAEMDPLSLNNLGQSANSGICIKIETNSSETPRPSTAGNITQRSESLQSEMATQIKCEISNPLSLENMGIQTSGMFKCKSCGRVFKRKETLKAHYIRLHTDIHRFSCEECGEKFKFFYYLNRHKRLRHPKENLTETSSKDLPLQKKKILRYRSVGDRFCKVCNKEFGTPSALKNHHIRMHTKEFKNPCELCFKKFKLHKDLVSHIKRLHPEQISSETQNNLRNLSKNEQESTEIQKDIIKMKEDSIEIVDHSVDIQEEPEEVEENSVEAPPSIKVENLTSSRLTCQICNKKFTRLDALRNHNIRLHTEGFKYPCEFCSKQFKLLKDLQRHRQRLHLKQKATETYRNSKELKQKTKEIEPQQNSTETTSSNKVEKVKEFFICEACGKKFARKASLQIHFTRKHTQELNYTCAECGKEFMVKKDMWSHLRRVHQKRSAGHEKTGEFVCNICGVKVLRKDTLRIHHLRKHTHQFKFSCKWCGKNFKVQGDLTTHTRLRHLEPPAVCEVCGKTCTNKHSLYVHQKYNHFQTQFRCPFCSKCYVSQENLDQHVVTHHEKKERLTCSDCGNTFASKSTLQNHIQCVHAEEKTFSCQVCGKLFPSHSRLRKHLITHTGKRLFICDICGKPFKQKPSLISHRKLHPGEHPRLPVIRLDDALSEFIQK